MLHLRWLSIPLQPNPLATLSQDLVQVLNALHMGWVEYCAALATARRMAADMDGRTLVVHNGDVSYAEGFVYGWDVFMHMMGPIVSRAPYMLTPGNGDECTLLTGRYR